MKSLSMTLLCGLLLSMTLNAQKLPTPKEKAKDPKMSVLFGLNQPLIFHGFNAEVNYWTKKWVFDYSHGFGLKTDGKKLGDEYTGQHLNFKITYSFGAGVGYRFTKGFNVRFEPKIHVYQTYYEGDKQMKANSIANFRTYTLGLGAYYRWLPFENKKNALKGITIAPSIRFWQKVGSSLDDNKLTYFNKVTGKSEVLKAPNIGISNTPLLANISIGYSF